MAERRILVCSSCATSAATQCEPDPSSRGTPSRPEASEARSLDSLQPKGYLAAEELLSDLSGCRSAGAIEEEARGLDLELPDVAPPESKLTRDTFRAVIHGNIDQVRACVEETLDQETVGQRLRYSVRFILRGNGTVDCLDPLNTSRRLGAFNRCVLPRMARWRFPAPGTSVVVHYPFKIEVQSNH